jgi:hypothetical protein
MIGHRTASRAARLLPLALLAGLLSIGSTARADETVSLATTIGLPAGSKPLAKFDISFVDGRTGLYVLADRSNAAVDVFSSAAPQFLFHVGGFAGAPDGNDTAGPNGVLTVHHREIWAGDGDSTVKVIDIQQQKIVDTIFTGGKKRADEMSWDRRDEILLVANDAEDLPAAGGRGPFITFISTRPGHRILRQIFFPEATNGIEQSQWSPKTGLFYLNLPEVDPRTGDGQVVVIDPERLRIVHRFPTHNCEAAGMALGPDNQALLGCAGGTSTGGTPLPNESQVIDLRNGHVVATFPQVGGSDEVWFNPGDNHYYLAARDNATGPVLGTIDADEPSFNNNAPTSSTGDHSVAADPIFNNVFVPLTAGAANTICPTGCIGIYRHGPLDADDQGDEHRREIAEDRDR